MAANSLYSAMWRSRALKVGGIWLSACFAIFIEYGIVTKFQLLLLQFWQMKTKVIALWYIARSLWELHCATFNSYKILDQEEMELRSNENPFSVIVLTALLAIVNKKVNDEGLKEIKHDLYDEMMKREMDKDTRQGLYDFLTYYVSFDNEDVLSIFPQ